MIVVVRCLLARGHGKPPASVVMLWIDATFERTHPMTQMTTYEFTAFTEQDLLDAGTGNGTNLGCGDTFTMPSGSTTCFSVTDNDAYLSGDGWCWGNEHATDWYGQTASITDAESGAELGNGRQIYAESYYWVHDQNGNWYVMIELEQEGTHDDYFSFYTGHGYELPPEGAELTVAAKCNVWGQWISFDNLDAGEKDAGGVFETEKDLVSTDEDTPLDFNVLDNDTAPAGEMLNVIFAGAGEITFEFDVAFEVTSTGGRTGMLTISTDGSVSFDPNEGFEDLDTGETDQVIFGYAAADESGNIGRDDVVITVNGVDDFEVVKDEVNVDEDSSIAFNVLDNDTASEGSILSVQQAGGGIIDFTFGDQIEFSSSGGRTGLLTILEDGSVDFDTNGGFEDLNEGDRDFVAFSYVAQDSNGNVGGEDVLIIVNGVDDLIV